MKNVLKIVMLGLVFAVCVCPFARAEEVAFELSATATSLSVGESGELHLTFNDTTTMPALELPRMDGLQLQYMGPSTSMTVVNGSMASSITHVYAMVPLKEGRFTIGPLKFDYKGKSYVSNPLTIQVGAPSGTNTGTAQAQGDAAGGDLKDRIILTAEIQKNRVYVNEIVPVKLRLLINGLNVRDVQFPDIKHDGLSLDALGQNRQYRQVINGVAYDVIEFPTTFFALHPGSLIFGPAHVQCTILVRQQNRRPPQGMGSFFDSGFFEDFFGGYQAVPVQVSAAEIPVTVLDLPREGRPQEFSGALGAFTMDVSAGPNQVHVGDPVTLKMTVRGEGNFKTVAAPRLAAEQGFKLYDPQVKEEAGAKTFEQIIMPMDAALTQVPAVRFAFFNPETGSYQSIEKGPLPITVVPPEKDEKSMIIEQSSARVPVREESLGRDIVFIKEAPGRFVRRGDMLYMNAPYRLLHVIPAAVFMALMIVQRRRRRLETDVRYARTLRAPRRAAAGIRDARSHLRSGDIPAFYDSVHRTLQGYLGDKFHVPSGGLTLGTVEEAIKDLGVDVEMKGKIRRVFESCDMARYAAGTADPEGMRQVLRDLEEVIDYFQRKKA